MEKTIYGTTELCPSLIPRFTGQKRDKLRDFQHLLPSTRYPGDITDCKYMKKKFVFWPINILKNRLLVYNAIDSKCNKIHNFSCLITAPRFVINAANISKGQAFSEPYRKVKKRYRRTMEMRGHILIRFHNREFLFH